MLLPDKHYLYASDAVTDCFSRFLCLPLVCAVSVLHILCLFWLKLSSQWKRTHWVQGFVTSCFCLVFDSSTDSAFTLRGLQPWQKTNRNARRSVVLSTLEKLARRMVARSEMDSNSCSGQLVGRCEVIVEFLARSGSLDCSLWLSLSKVEHFRTSHVS